LIELKVWLRKTVHNIVAKANVLPLATLLPPLRVHSPGGFVMVGQAVNYHENPEPYGQMGWLVKTNPYGCIVPGCQFGDNPVDAEPKDTSIMNPP